jgi:hypothetical protein
LFFFGLKELALEFADDTVDCRAAVGCFIRSNKRFTTLAVKDHIAGYIPALVIEDNFAFLEFLTQALNVI